VSVVLNWSTAAEFNHERFELLRSTDNINFYVIKTIFSSGNSNTIKKYTHTDMVMQSSVAYYKLIQYDFDGKSETFDILKVKLNQSSVNIYPNPVTSVLTIDQQNSESTSDIKLYNSQGLLINTYKRNPDNITRVNTSDFAKGFYFLEVDGKRYRLVKS